jgi:hypothetical protein
VRACVRTQRRGGRPEDSDEDDHGRGADGKIAASTLTIKDPFTASALKWSTFEGGSKVFITENSPVGSVGVSAGLLAWRERAGAGSLSIL